VRTIIEGTIFNIQKYSIHDGPGIRTIVFLKGCPLKCMWCSNPESQSSDIQICFKENLCVGCGSCIKICSKNAIKYDEDFGKKIDYSACNLCKECVNACPAKALVTIGENADIEQIVKTVMQDTIFYRKSGGGVTLGGGEPLFQPNLAMELLMRFRHNGLHTAVETCGFTKWENIERAIPYVDLFLFDMKHISNKKHIEYTGQGNNLILENMKKLDLSGKKYWVRIPLIPGVNDTKKTIFEMMDFIKSELKNVVKVEMLPYHQLGIGKYAQMGMKYNMGNVEKNSDKRMQEIKIMVMKQYPSVNFELTI